MENYAYEPNENDGRHFAVASHPPINKQTNNLVEVNSKGKIFNISTCFKIIAILPLLLALVLLIGLLNKAVTFSKSKQNICMSEECHTTAVKLYTPMDMTVGPCDDFYKFTCGQWEEEHPDRGKMSSFSSFTRNTERVAISALEALTSENSEPDDPRALRKSRDFYKSCMDVGAIDELGLTSMYQYLQRSHLPIIPSYLSITEEDKAAFTFDWMQSEILIKQMFMVDIFFGTVVDANIHNGSENVIYVGQPYQKCPLPSTLRKKKFGYQKIINTVQGYSNDDDEDSETSKTMSRDVNSNIIKYVLQEILTNNSVKLPRDDLLQSAADTIMDMSNEIEELVANYNGPNEKGIFSITINELQSHTDNFLTKPEPGIWLKYFNYLFAGTNVTIDPKKDLLYVTEMDLHSMKMIIQYVQRTPDINLELYMWWATVDAMIINTSSDVVEYISKQLGYFASGSANNQTRSRSLECVSLVNKHMGYAVSYAIADPFFSKETKPVVEKMAKVLRNAFVKYVNDLNWLDGSTKQVALEKFEEIVALIGYPDWLFQNEELDRYYAEVIIKRDTFLDNMMNSIIFCNLRKMNSLRTKYERDWLGCPFEFNAFSSSLDDDINIPMAILTFPMFKLQLEEIKYATIGTILGYEFLHGLHNSGRRLDKYGNLVQLWSEQSINNLTECFVEQYDGIEGDVKGANTLGEILADHGGVKLAFNAYKSHLETAGEEQVLPMFENLSKNQIFFLLYSGARCEATDWKATLEIDMIEHSSYSSNYVRVTATLQNSEDFSQAFNCPVGSFMNPKKKCKIW